MSEQKRSGNLSAVGTVLLVAVLVGAVGFYTENDGFTLAGAIFLVVGLVLGIQYFRATP